MNKNSESKDNFIFNWVFKNKLAIGTSPTKQEDINLLKKFKIKNVLALCSEKEIMWHENLEYDFSCKRVVLPDSNKNKLPSKDELNVAYNTLKNFVNNNNTFIHCFASMERSPLLCIMLIMDTYNLDLEESLDYLKRVHSYTNPRNNQLLLIKNFDFEK